MYIFTTRSYVESITPAIVIAGSALVFTVASFWWLNARRGRLTMTEVRIFSAYIRSDLSLLRLPITLFNTGASALVVVDLRLQMQSGESRATLATRTFRTTIRPGSDDVDDFPYPYAVAGRSVVTRFVEFTGDARVMAAGKPATIQLEALIDRKGWREIGSSTVRLDCVADPKQYITYSNDPAHWRDGQLSRASRALEDVRAELEKLPNSASGR
ncbi:hypothetical protein CAE01nite_28760 [Cellulomonas aerilata]|uniref:Uncharacterized protein n=1 Tax=Cellulomonas aerilata TaxID=515326 RepID=A0A512DFC6_9CELL|nr:hypothetical protein CAE01nite_28760 [Cellulomonas aerilata]